jgi:broad specificity phosphatase PhoE
MTDRGKVMTEMWLVRHGQTDWNLNGIYQGQSDIPLNETGIQQAHQLASELTHTRFHRIYSSDLVRARQTAEIIATELGVPVVVDARLREINQGVWEGKTIEYVKQTYQPDFSRNPKYITTPRAEGAESLAQVIIRMVEAVNAYHAAHPGGRILLATHGLSAAGLYCVVNGIELVDVVQYIPENGQPLVITVEEPLSLPDFTKTLI